MTDLGIFISHHLQETYALALILVLLMLIEFVRLKRNNFSVDTVKAIHLINRENAVILDLRSKEAFSKGHIVDAHLVSAKEISENPKKIEKFRTKPILLVCDNGLTSQKIAAEWSKKGYNIYLLAQGIRSWQNAGLPLVKE